MHLISSMFELDCFKHVRISFRVEGLNPYSARRNKVVPARLMEPDGSLMPFLF